MYALDQKSTSENSPPQKRGKNMKKHLDKRFPNMLQNQGKCGTLGAMTLFRIFALYVGVSGSQKKSLIDCIDSGTFFSQGSVFRHVVGARKQFH